MPAYNAARTLVDCYKALPKEIVDEVVIVDDASTDNTVEIAGTLPARVFVHQKNLGYGGNQKTCYKEAVNIGADVIIMVHPDHQYDPKFIPEFVENMVDGGFVAVFGSRMINRQGALDGGMPKWKFYANIFLTQIGNFFLSLNLTEFHSGFRAYSANVFKRIDISRNSDDFVFDTQIIIQLVAAGIKIKEIPITTRYFKDASQISVFPSIKYGLGILYNLFLYKSGLRKF